MNVTDEQMENIERQITSFCKRMAVLGCDAVHISVSAVDSPNTRFVHYGSGNTFARRELVRCWLRDGEDINLAHEISEAVNEEEE